MLRYSYFWMVEDHWGSNDNNVPSISYRTWWFYHYYYPHTLSHTLCSLLAGSFSHFKVFSSYQAVLRSVHELIAEFCCIFLLSWRWWLGWIWMMIIELVEDALWGGAGVAITRMLMLNARFWVDLWHFEPLFCRMREMIPMTPCC